MEILVEATALESRGSYKNENVYIHYIKHSVWVSQSIACFVLTKRMTAFCMESNRTLHNIEDYC